MRTSLLLISLLLTAAVAAPLSFVRPPNAEAIPAELRSLAGNELLNGAYLDDDQRSRHDKVFFTITHNYRSAEPAEALNELLDPANGRVAEIFKDPTTMRPAGANVYNVETQVDAMLTTLEVQSRLAYSKSRQGSLTTHIYRSHSFSMFFHQVVTKVEIDASGPVVQVRISQVTAVKGSAWAKLRLIPFGERTLRRMVSDHAQSFYRALKGQG